MVESNATLSVRKAVRAARHQSLGAVLRAYATSPDELELMRRIDELHLKWPHLGSHQALGYQTPDAFYRSMRAMAA